MPCDACGQKIIFQGTNQPTGSRGPLGIGVRWVANEISRRMVFERTGETRGQGWVKLDYRFVSLSIVRHASQHLESIS